MIVKELVIEKRIDMIQRRITITGFFTILLLLLSGDSLADEININGKVTDGSNVPVKDAVMMLKLSHLSDTTDKNGDYLINGVTGIVQENPVFCGPMMHVSQGTLSLSGFEQ